MHPSHVGAAAAIQQLPTEILVQIFQLVGPLSSLHWDRIATKPVFRLVTVCRRWHNIIMSTPLLWNTISIVCSNRVAQKLSTHLRRLQAQLSRSYPAAIDLYIIVNATGAACFNSFAPLIESALHRCHYLRYQNNINPISLPGADTLHKLERLEVCGVVPLMKRSSLPIQPNATTLRDLRIQGIADYHHASTWPLPFGHYQTHLSSLTIHNSARPYDVVSLLRGCTALECFSWTITLGESGHPPVMPPIDDPLILRSLRSADIIGAPAIASLCNISAPKLARLCLYREPHGVEIAGAHHPPAERTIRKWLIPLEENDGLMTSLRFVRVQVPSEWNSGDVATFLGGLADLEHVELAGLRERHVDGISAFGRGKSWSSRDPHAKRITLIIPDWNTFTIPDERLATAIRDAFNAQRIRNQHLPLDVRVHGPGVRMSSLRGDELVELTRLMKEEPCLSVTASYRGMFEGD